MPLIPAQTLGVLCLLSLLGWSVPRPGTDAARPVQGQARQATSVVDLRTEYAVNPLGIDVRMPRLSWRMESDRRGTMQAAYRVRVARSEASLATDPVWDTERITSGRSIHVPYEGPALESGSRYWWQVQVEDDAGVVSDWSEPAYWETGLLDESDWQASWITPPWDDDSDQMPPSPLLRTEFEVDGEVERARAYVTSLGLYEMELNGRRVGDQVFTPGWTSYDTRLQYQTYDVTGLLVQGDNAVGATLGDGWYRGHISGWGRRNGYGDRLALLTRIEITYADGRRQTVGSDASWRAATGPILHSDIYMGEAYDARLERPGWSTAGYDDATWQAVRMLDHPKDMLMAPPGPPVRRVEEIRPVAILHTPAGETVVDLGQNMVGWVRLRVRGDAGDTVTLRHAEVLDREGNFYTGNLRAATQQVTYVLKGGGEEVYEPHFTFQGFRYVAVEGWPGDLTLDSITGIVIHSDMRVTGRFESSNPMIDQLQHNIVWGQKGNFLDVPTDCPQRDERLGWTGDAQVFARTAAFNMDVAGFFTKWLGDLAADQRSDGSIPWIIPDVHTLRRETGPTATGWADAAVVIPWTMYLTYGDTRLLETQYPSMTAWIAYMRQRAGDDLVWSGDAHFGDWLAYATTRSDYPGATTDKELIATAYFAHSSDLVGRMAAVIGRTDDAGYYAALADSVRQAFRREFVTPGGRVASNTQTAYSLALAFDLLPDDQVDQAADRLADDVRGFGHLTTGFLGTPLLCHVLGEHGHMDVAYDLLNRTEYPSWLYPVTQGATTIWERWDGQKPDSTFQDEGMNSFNHYAYGAIGEWMYRVVAGLEIDPDEPGYRHVIVQPRPGGGLTSASASFDSMYGEVKSAWTLEDGRMRLDVTVPPNTYATVRMPGARPEQVTERGVPIRDAVGITGVDGYGGGAVVRVGSGRYRFEYLAADSGD